MNISKEQECGTTLLLIVLLFLGFLCTQPVSAAVVSWEQLSAREQQVLKPFQKQWTKYPQRTQKTMRRWAQLSSGERGRIKQRHAQWRKLAAASKAKIVRKLDRYKRMPLAKRLKLKAWRKWVKSLPGHEQKKLHQKLPGMGIKERKEYIRQLEKKYGKR